MCTPARRCAESGQEGAFAGARDIYTKERVVIPINLPGGQVFHLRLPRLLPIPDDEADDFTFGLRRTWNDTCGLYDIIHYRTTPAGFGVPPHIHYLDDEVRFA
jgi:hypothetical protein